MLQGQTIQALFSVSQNESFVDAEITSVKLWRNNTETTVIVTIAEIKNGVFHFTFSIPTNWLVGDAIALEINYNSQGFNNRSKLIKLGEIEIDLEEALKVINRNVKKASLIIPAKEDI